MIPPLCLEEFANRVIDRCESTNDLAWALGEAGFPDGTWVSARVQEAGRGRLGRRWESQEGNLFLSVVVRSLDRSNWTWVPLAAAVGATKAISPLFRAIRIKWPNDLWIGESKVGGILCEASGTSPFLVVGLGLNCRYSPKNLAEHSDGFNVSLPPPATSLLEAAPELRIDVDEIRESVIEGLQQAFAELRIQGPTAIRSQYAAAALFTPGTEVEWLSTQRNEKKTGIVVGLGESGELLVRIDPSHPIAHLFAEEVRVRATRKAADGSLL